MTCVLSMPSLYSFDDGSDLTNTSQDLEFNWIHDLPQQSGGFGINYVHDGVRYSTPCRADASPLPKSCDWKESKDVMAQSTVVNDVPEPGVWCKEPEQRKGARTDCETKGMSICKTVTHQFTEKLLNVPNNASSQGIKRKCEETEGTHVPFKRISPFLNTPKGRKDERKAILKLSIKKLKQLEDPELCLRRTVLINNTMKRLQAEVREEQYQSRPFGTYTRHKSICKYGRLENKCMSNSYLFDDPFLSGVHEKITDDMTEMLVNNVLNYKSSDATIGYDKKDISENTSDKLPCNERRPDRSVERCSIQGNSISLDACNTQSLQDACKFLNEDGGNKFSETYCEPMDISISSNNFENSKFSESLLVESKNTLDCIRSNPVKNMCNGKVIGCASHTSNPTETNIDRQTHNGCSLENLKHLLSDIEFGNENSCDINVRYVSSKALDKKPISHSFNTFSMSSDSYLSWYMSPTTC